jgi:hypothetical protein
MEEKMNTTMTRFGMGNMSKLAPLCLVALLTFGLFFMNLREGASIGAQSHTLSDVVLTTTVGADAGACGIFAGLAIGVVAAAAGGVTVGLGAAVVISAGLHISAAICVS